MSAVQRTVEVTFEVDQMTWWIVETQEAEGEWTEYPSPRYDASARAADAALSLAKSGVSARVVRLEPESPENE